MRALFFTMLCLGAALFRDATARTEFRLGGPEGNRWQAALSLDEVGEYVVFDEGGQEVRREPVSASPFEEPLDRLNDFSGNTLRPFFVEAGVNLVLTDPDVTVDTDIPLPYTGGNVFTTGGCIDGFGRSKAKTMFDGDPSSAFFHPIRPSFLHGGGRLGSQAASLVTPIIDLHGGVPINRIRFYPRLGQKADLRLIEFFAEPAYPVDRFSFDSFAENFLAGYEIRLGDSAQPIFDHPCDDEGACRVCTRQGRVGGLSWVVNNDPKLRRLKLTQENLDPVVDLEFQRQYVRWISFKPLPDASWEVAELEVYGEGYVETATYLTRVLDFGQRVNWGNIRWSGAFPRHTQMEIRTRTGNTPDPKLYFAPDANGNVLPVTLDEYEDINFLERSPLVYDAANWSFWSPPYDIQAGRRDSTFAAETWEDGSPLIGLGSSRYLQLQIRLTSVFETAPRLDQIAIQFSETPPAEEILGEVWPIDVLSIEPTTFTYVVKPLFVAGNTGFDRLEILTHNRASVVHSVSIDGKPLDLDTYSPAISADRIVVELPYRQADPDSSLKQIEVVFDVPILRFGTLFTGWIYATDDPDQIKQRIQPGNATFRFSSDGLSVRSPIGGDLLVGLNVAPNPFTPNGDGVNEQITISYTLRELTAPREVLLEIYNLSGHLVGKIPGLSSASGIYQQFWDGRDRAGDLVPPGTYVYRLRLDAEIAEEKMGVVAVAY